MNIYLITEDGEANCYKAETPMEAIEASVVRYIDSLTPEEMGLYLQEHGESPRTWFLRTCFESCALVGELVN